MGGGGRKELCITLSFLAQPFDINGVCHIVLPDVKTFNQLLELIRYDAKKLAKAED